MPAPAGTFRKTRSISRGSDARRKDSDSPALNVISAPGKGSRFEVWLPCQAVGGATTSEPSEAEFGRGQTVLLLRSSRKQALHDEEILAALGYEPVGFWRAADAVAACRENPDRFDAILIGCSLSAKQTRSLPAFLHGIEHRLPVVIAAEPPEKFDVDALVTAGVCEVVTRPMVADEIAAALARCLRTKSHQGAMTANPAGRATANAMH